MENPGVTYVIYIATAPEILWQALTSPASLRENWGIIESDWTVGSRVTEVSESGKLLWSGEVVLCAPPRLLAYTFDVTGSGEPPTEVRFEISLPASAVAAAESIVQLTVTQTGFPADSKLFAGCAHAWPEIFSSIKTYLEAGRPLPFAWKH